MAVFHKKLKNYVNPNSIVITDFAYLRPTLTAANQALLGTTLGITRGPDNAGKGTIKGAEATLSLPFSMVTGALDGFGGDLVEHHARDRHRRLSRVGR